MKNDFVSCLFYSVCTVALLIFGLLNSRDQLTDNINVYLCQLILTCSLYFLRSAAEKYRVCNLKQVHGHQCSGHHRRHTYQIEK